MKAICKSVIVLTLWLALAGTLAVRAAEYQWSVRMTPTLPDTNRQPRAFLWIPPNCNRVRAVVFAQHNMIEEGILENACFRQTLSDLGFAEIWVTPSSDPVFRADRGAEDNFVAMLKALAEESGYSELEFAPIAPLGHSAHASYPWNFAAWNPERTLAMLSVHGDAPLTPLTGSGRPNPDWGSRNIDGIPGLMVMGEYEWWQARLDPLIDFHKKNPRAPLSLLADVGHGHFDYSDQLISYLAMFLRKAAADRLPEDAPLDKPPKLIALDPQRGWLVDQWRKGQTLKARAAPYAEYKGNRDEAFWCFDKEMALATQNFNDQRGRLPQLLGFEQAGKVVPQDVPRTHQQVSLKFLPEADGISFRLKGVFIDTVPDFNPTSWTGLPAGAHIDHATGGGPVMVSRISGPLVRTGPETWAVRFYRGSDVTDLSKKRDDLWFLASHEGDDRYKSAVQQAVMTIPMRNTEGAVQHINFPQIANQTNGVTFLKLNGISDAGVPVYYYVREGPAEMEGDTLRFTAIPPRAKYPIKVTVVAWQYGRSVEPKLKSAEPVVQTFSITK